MCLLFYYSNWIYLESKICVSLPAYKIAKFKKNIYKPCCCRQINICEPEKKPNKNIIEKRYEGRVLGWEAVSDCAFFRFYCHFYTFIFSQTSVPTPLGMVVALSPVILLRLFIFICKMCLFSYLTENNIRLGAFHVFS